MQTYTVSLETTIVRLENARLTPMHSKLLDYYAIILLVGKVLSFDEKEYEKKALCVLLYKMSQNIKDILQPLFPAYPLNYFMAMPFMSNTAILKCVIIKTLLHVTSYFYTDIYIYMYG